MQRRNFLAGTACLPSLAFAHHGWSSFDQDKPIFVEGVAADVAWTNPHVEVKLRVPEDLRLPADFARRSMPAQSAGVDAARILAGTRVPRRRPTNGEWEIELAPLSRMDAWKVPKIEKGQRIGVVGYTFADEKGEAIIRAEFLFVGDKAYGLRSSPA